MNGRDPTRRWPLRLLLALPGALWTSAVVSSTGIGFALRTVRATLLIGGRSFFVTGARSTGDEPN